MSSPPWPFTTIESVASSVLMVVIAARPLIVAEVADATMATLSLPLLPLTVTTSLWPSPADPPSVDARLTVTCFTSVPAMLPTTMLSAPPSALKSDMLDIIQVHGHCGHVAEEAGACAIGREVDVLADVGAVEQQRVDAGLALDDVVAIARIPLERIVSGAEKGDVVALVAVDEVVAVAADQDVGAARCRGSYRCRRRRRS